MRLKAFQMGRRSVPDRSVLLAVSTSAELVVALQGALGVSGGRPSEVTAGRVAHFHLELGTARSSSLSRFLYNLAKERHLLRRDLVPGLLYRTYLPRPVLQAGPAEGGAFAPRGPLALNAVDRAGNDARFFHQAALQFAETATQRDRCRAGLLLIVRLCLPRFDDVPGRVDANVPLIPRARPARLMRGSPVGEYLLMKVT